MTFWEIIFQPLLKSIGNQQLSVNNNQAFAPVTFSDRLYQIFIAMMWLDEDSELYRTINQHISLGLIHKLSRNTDLVNVIGRFIDTPEEVKSLIINSPTYIEMNEVT